MTRLLLSGLARLKEAWAELGSGHDTVQVPMVPLIWANIGMAMGGTIYSSRSHPTFGRPPLPLTQTRLARAGRAGLATSPHPT